MKEHIICISKYASILCDVKLHMFKGLYIESIPFELCRTKYALGRVGGQRVACGAAALREVRDAVALVEFAATLHIKH